MKTFKLNQIVFCPEDRGIKGGPGKIVFIADRIQTNVHGKKYQWVTVFRKDHNEVWPSHRLS